MTGGERRGLGWGLVAAGLLLMVLFVSTASGAVVQGPPLSTVAPVVSGVAVVGQTLTVTSGSWVGAGPLAFGYQWQQCDAAGASCVPLAGATGQTLAVPAGSVAGTLRVQVTATNAAGASSVLSNATAAVAASLPAAVTTLVGGGLSLPVADVTPPSDRLRLVSVRLLPTRPVVGRPFRVRVRVGDLGGYVIEGALVSIVGLPNGFLRTPAATTTGVDGSTTQTLQPTVLATAARGFTPSLSIRVDAPGDSTGGLATNGVFAVPLGQSGSAAANEVNVYASGTHGYDLSFPNCARPRPRQADFAIVGVNGGRPFTFNRCLAAEYQWAATRGPVAVYLNTGYTRRLRELISPACALAGGGSSLAAEAFAVGCSEAASSFERMTLLGLAAPAVWWLDVETSNAWSANRRLNTQVLAGMIAFLQRLTPTPVVGVYSNQSWWRKIMGGWALAAPEWIPQAPSGVCPAPFSSGSVWLSQGGSSTLDQDNSC